MNNQTTTNEYFSITEREVFSHKNNILIPICLGNKFFSEKGVLSDNLKKYLAWALKNTKEKVLFVVVDKIQDTNYFVRNKGKTEMASLRNVLKEGQILKKSIQDLIQTLSVDQQKQVQVICWEDYEQQDPWVHPITHTVYKEFKNNHSFRGAIQGVIKTSVTDRVFSEDNYWRLCDYVLDEFSIVYSGIRYNNDYYGIFIYPNTDSVVYLIEDIKSSKKFPKLTARLPDQRIGLVVLKNYE